MPEPSITDIHCHPELKTFLSGNDEPSRFDCWHNINLPNLLELVDRVLLGNIMEPQCSLTQLNTVSGTIALSGLYALEKAMITGDLIFLGSNASLVDVALILKILRHPKIINYELMKRLSLPQTKYYQVFQEVQDHLLKSRTINPQFNPMNKIGDYKQDKLNIVLTIEGGHNLFDNTSDSSVYGDVIQHLKDLKSNGRKYLFMGLAHLERNPLCTHAYGIKLIKHDDFKPVGSGISNLGKDVIREALKEPNRILIDIKHMSLEARKQYYKMLENEYNSERIPILISHGGVTGVSWDNKPVSCRKKYRKWIKVTYFKPKGVMGTKFNPWSINLYDEEITKIVGSDGLIGLNLDERILGAKQKRRRERVEYFSPGEFNSRDFRKQFFRSLFALDRFEVSTQEERLPREIRIQLLSYLRDIIRHPDQININRFNSEIERLHQLLPPRTRSPRGVKHLCNNILHIVRVAGDEGWKHISIGSDFDGLINSVDTCWNSTEYDSLSQDLITRLPTMADEIPGFPHIVDIQQKVYDIMSGNAYKFLQKYFI